MDTPTVAQTTDIAKFLTLFEAAVVSGVSVKTLRRRVLDGTIPAVLLAGKYRIREDHLAGWMHQAKAA